VPDNLEALTCGNRSLRSDLRIVRRNSLKHEVVEADADFTQFYQTMYLPFVRRRHAQQLSFAMITGCVGHPARRAHVDTAGRSARRWPPLPTARSGAVLRCNRTARGEDRFVREGANIATDLFFWNTQRGSADLIDFGGSRPFLTMVCCAIKRKWG